MRQSFAPSKAGLFVFDKSSFLKIWSFSLLSIFSLLTRSVACSKIASCKGVAVSKRSLIQHQKWPKLLQTMELHSAWSCRERVNSRKGIFGIFWAATQPRPQSNFKKIALAPYGFAGNFYLIWFANCKTIKINLCNAVNFP